MVYTKSELKEILRQTNRDYDKELRLNGVTAELRYLDNLRTKIQSKLSKGIYL